MKDDYIVYNAKLKDSDQYYPQVYERRFYTNGWSAIIIQNYSGAFDNECLFEESILHSNMEDIENRITILTLN